MDDLVVRTISSQLSIKANGGRSFLNLCFDSLETYFDDERYMYILIDCHTQTSNRWFRVRSKIFPDDKDEFGKCYELCFLPNKRMKLLFNFYFPAL